MERGNFAPLGREDEKLSEQKEEFIQALVEFDDGCRNFYQYRAYSLAAAGIAEFGECSRADEIVAQIVKLGFGCFDIKKQKRVTFFDLIAEGARAVLPETERTKAILALVELIQNSQDEYTCMVAASTLGYILGEDQMAGVVITLKDCLSNEIYENDFKRFDYCYKVIWHYAQAMPYPAFYQAWHNPPLTPYPEVPETTGASFNPDSHSLNLTELPSLLRIAIDSDSEVRSKLQLIAQGVLTTNAQR